MRTLVLALILSAAAAPALAQQAAPSARATGLRYLTWPGKVQRASPRQAQRPAPRPPIAPAPTAVGPAFQPQASASVQPRPAPAAPVRRNASWSYRPVPHGPTHFLGQVTPAQAAAIERKRVAAREEAEEAMALAEVAKAKAEAERKQAQSGSAPPQPPARVLPDSIYAAPPPARTAQAAPAGPSRLASAGGSDEHARFYSLHRAYGERPDPVSLSPQFLATPTADLADPPPPPPPHILPGQVATPAQQTAARVAARNAESSD